MSTWHPIDDHEAFNGNDNAWVRVSTRYKKLVSLLGEPNGEIDGFKVTTAWLLQNEEGDLAKVTDWKATAKYDSAYPTVEKFRSLPLYEWAVWAERPEVARACAAWLKENT